MNSDPGFFLELIEAHLTCYAALLPKCLYPTVAAQAMGVPVPTLRAWLKRGSEELSRMVEEGRDTPAPAEALYVRLLAVHRQAGALSQAKAVQTIKDAAQTDWQAAAWLLERRWPRAWSARERKKQAEARERIKDLEQQLAVLKSSQQTYRPESTKELDAALEELGGVFADDDEAEQQALDAAVKELAAVINAGIAG